MQASKLKEESHSVIKSLIFLLFLLSNLFYEKNSIWKPQERSHNLISWKKMKALVAQSRPTLCNAMDCSLPGSSVHWILQSRILEWVAISFPRGSFRPGSPALQADSLSSEPWGKCVYFLLLAYFLFIFSGCMATHSFSSDLLHIFTHPCLSMGMNIML